MNNQTVNRGQGGMVGPMASVPAATLVRGGVTRPAWGGGRARQRVVLALDRSPSMAGEKARDASQAAREFVQEVARAPGGVFDLAVVEFAGSAKLVQPLQPAGELAGRLRDLETGGLSTNIGKALQEIVDTLAAAPAVPAAEREIKLVAILMTDGMHTGWFSPDRAADRVKAMADLVTVAFGPDADEAGLRRWATSPQHFYRVTDGRELRRFLAAAGATLTRTMAAGRNATQALTGLGRP